MSVRAHSSAFAAAQVGRVSAASPLRREPRCVADHEEIPSCHLACITNRGRTRLTTRTSRRASPHAVAVRAVAVRAGVPAAVRRWKSRNRVIRVWHGATETGPWMMDKSQSLWHDCRSCRRLALSRGVLDSSINQQPFSVTKCQTLIARFATVSSRQAAHVQGGCRAEPTRGWHGRVAAAAAACEVASDGRARRRPS